MSTHQNCTCTKCQMGYSCSEQLIAAITTKGVVGHSCARKKCSLRLQNEHPGATFVEVQAQSGQLPNMRLIALQLERTSPDIYPSLAPGLLGQTASF